MRSAREDPWEAKALEQKARQGHVLQYWFLAQPGHQAADLEQLQRALSMPGSKVRKAIQYLSPGFQSPRLHGPIRLKVARAHQL